MEFFLGKCKYCGEFGIIDYYYMGFLIKVKRWYGNLVMCSDMFDYWREKDYWFYINERG